MNVVFFGTPEFAVPSLRGLIGEGFDIRAVVTQPDKPRGRSRSVAVHPAVKTVALSENLPTLQPANPNTPEFAAELRKYEPWLGVVVAYGHILKPELLALPTRGMINVHASLLPAFRGAAPIQHALIEGLTETGVSIMQMEQGMDTGPVYHRVTTPVATDETFGELHDRLAEVGALALIEALTLIELGAAEAGPQDHDHASFAPKITRDTARIDWSAAPEAVARLVRAMDPSPGAWTTIPERGDVKVYGPSVEMNRAGSPGEVLTTSPNLMVATGTGAVTLSVVQPAGKRRMPARDWCRGRSIEVGQFLV